MIKNYDVYRETKKALKNFAPQDVHNFIVFHQLDTMPPEGADVLLKQVSAMDEAGQRQFYRDAIKRSL